MAIEHRNALANGRYLLSLQAFILVCIVLVEATLMATLNLEPAISTRYRIERVITDVPWSM